MKKLILRLAKRQLLKVLDSQEFNDRLVRILNRKIDLPGLNEDEEAKLLDAVVYSVKCVIIDLV